MTSPPVTGEVSQLPHHISRKLHQQCREPREDGASHPPGQGDTQQAAGSASLELRAVSTGAFSMGSWLRDSEQK